MRLTLRLLRSFASIAMCPNSMLILPGREAERSPKLDGLRTFPIPGG
ncbi:MAG: hypothetical protein IMW90_01465 [Thermogemmatispora sp.]|jgi:hypothetical protein|uniref:Uncharacterized protein n=1 Tax=Thermogemmatispora aurantia TaxID=2045279 RepID=A0A5J4K701_9CHLR|nr:MULTISPECIES: hypothetical protein [Thermogemmatispora]MBE3564375.1 hypothetical protein [Thermogemmatispora sp.]GER82469.1 hypothetical protein KTAU_11060 [Thermogemmatispora aurantia]